jgi:hypothetical protein
MNAFHCRPRLARSIGSLFLLLFTFPAGRPAAAQAEGAAFRAPDGSFVCQTPPGWTASTAALGTQPVTVFAPADGGPERVLAFANTVVGSVQDVARQAAGFTARIFPGVTPEGPPEYSEVAGLPAAWIAYRGTLANGVTARIWSGVLLKGRFAFWVVGLATPESADRGEAVTRALFASLKPGEIPENTALAQAILGQWEYYYSNSSGTGEHRFNFWLQKLLNFGADGRFAYQVANSEGAQSQASGSYRVYGNSLYIEVDGGGPAVFALELLSRDGLKIEGELYLRR